MIFINDNAPSRPFSILNGIIGGIRSCSTAITMSQLCFQMGVYLVQVMYISIPTMSLYLVSVLYISISMARLYRKNFIDYVVSLDAHHFFTNHIASLLKESFENKMSHSHRLYKHLDKNLLAKRIVIHIIIISILLSAGALTYFAIDIIEDKLSFGSSLRQILLNFGISNSMNCQGQPCIVEKAMNEESCWESFVGKAIYQLAVAYVLILLLGTFVMELLHRILNSIFNKIPPPDFDTSRNSTHLIYSQSIALIGYYFVPGISLFMIFSSMLTFYVKLLSLRFNCSKSKTPWRAARSQTVFMVYAFFSTLISVIGYIFVASALHRLDSFIFKPAFIIGLIVILLVSIYYTQSLNRTYVIETKKLKENINRQK
ncbi:TMC [Lepeophtheirus salmonis]|nr:TMC [Lepeophtheirus salmonis]CAF2970422.1 TMC [Lepeophtheirus salmonis]